MARNGSARQQVVMKRNPLEGNPALCGFCGDVYEPKPVDLFIEDTMIPVCPGCGETEAPELSNIMQGRPWWLTRQMHDAMECGPQPGDLVGDFEESAGPLYECAACDARFLVTALGPCAEKCPNCGGTLGLLPPGGSGGPSAGDPEQDEKPRRPRDLFSGGDPLPL
jgi:hypothetical protein